MGENSEFKRRFLTFLSQNCKPEDHMKDFNILDAYLSPSRDQKDKESCLFVAMAACLEMTLRILGIEVPSWQNMYFLDVGDAIDRLWKIYPVAHDATGPIMIETMLAFVLNYGFKVTSLCKEPRAVDHLANYDNEALRCIIHGYTKLEESEVLKRVEQFPIIAGVYPYSSLVFCHEAFYGGPSKYEIMFKGTLTSQHSVLVVGSLTVERPSGNQIYLIVQNSWKKTDGFYGFFMIPFDCTDIFTVFVLPHIDPEKFPYKKMENGKTQFVERHRHKRSREVEKEETSGPSCGDDIMDLDP